MQIIQLPIRQIHYIVRLAVFILCCLANGTASAHTVGVSHGEYQISRDSIQADLYFSHKELKAAFYATGEIKNADTETEPRDQRLFLRQLSLQENIIDGINVKTDVGVCDGLLKYISLVKADGILLKAEFQCHRSFTQASVQINFLNKLARGHRHIIKAKTSDVVVSSTVVYEGKDAFELSSNIAESNAGSSLGSFFVFGLEHIISGFDHLLFLFGLVLIAVNIRSLMLVITAFTFAHSITLGLSVLDILVIKAAFIEPLIALSIVYVGIENVICKNFHKRWRLTFFFGLIHGFGFAGALREIALPMNEIPVALIGFNLGVEAGQVMAIALVLPMLLLLRKKAWFASSGVRIGSLGLILMGAYWFFDRLLSSDALAFPALTGTEMGLLVAISLFITVLAVGLWKIAQELRA